MNEDNCTCEGILKQQNIDSNGLYIWEEHFFRLHINDAILESFQDSKSSINGDKSLCTELSLVGSKHAKEWSLMTPSVGSYGFDVVWSSGRIWSFLADDEFSCRKWVESINKAISLNPLQANRGYSMSSDDKNSGINHTRLSYDRTEETIVEHSSPPRIESSLAHAQPTVSKYNHQHVFRPPNNVEFDGSISSSQGAPMKPPAVHYSSTRPVDGSFNMSAIPMISSRSPSELSPESGDNSHKLEEEVVLREAERSHILRSIAPFDMTKDSSQTRLAREAEREPGSQRGGEDVQEQLVALMQRWEYNILMHYSFDLI